MANGLCDHECPGYDQEPFAGSLWPGETDQEFGYSCGDVGTRQVDQITAFACPPRCEHSMDGPMVELDGGRVTTRTCSKCGATAFDVSMMEGK
jgi:hypothetical protein